MNHCREADAYDAAFCGRSPLLDLREERDSDRAFQLALFVACSPLGAILPPSLLWQQAEAQLASHRLHNPDAMCRVVSVDGVPVGRVAIDWHAMNHSYCVDIAVLPDARETGAGLHMLRTWLDVADLFGQPCRLDVLRSNPAVRLYSWLGFKICGRNDGSSPIIAMVRQPSVR